MIARLLRAVLLLTLADGEIQQAGSVERDATAEVGVRLAPRIRDEDVLDVLQRRAVEHRACERGGREVVLTGLRVAQIDDLVLGEPRMQRDVEKTGEHAREHVRCSGDRRRIELAVANDSQPTLALGDQDARRQGGTQASTDARDQSPPARHGLGARTRRTSAAASEAAARTAAPAPTATTRRRCSTRRPAPRQEPHVWSSESRFGSWKLGVGSCSWLHQPECHERVS